MSSTQQLWAPIPTIIHSSTPIDDATAAENISTFLQIHHGELPGDSNATASLVRLIQGLRDDSRLVKGSIAPVDTSNSPKKKRKRDRGDANASTIADTTTADPVANESTILEGEEPAKKKKKKDKKEKKEKKEKKSKNGDAAQE
ncbi:hypothetical protein P389DRAFT_48190 [Cystobasidium minutum MCA 4210]|uniref:uncharacterized protein n=1 Tax=Cystobasidium minutum MCA 4210 TaxID=1397322 RepID=UPI0034CF3FA8|eukprot:jgi/Rhomi1/48190/CE48189_163